MKKRWLVVLPIVLAGLVVQAQRQVGDARNEAVRTASDTVLQFEYAFSGPGPDADVPRVALPADLGSGDEFVVVVRPRRAVYAYLFVSTSRGTLQLLRPLDGDAPVRPEPLTAARWSKLPVGGPMRLDQYPGVEHLPGYLFRPPAGDRGAARGRGRRGSRGGRGVAGGLAGQRHRRQPGDAGTPQ